MNVFDTFEMPWKEIAIFLAGMLVGVLIAPGI
jgi:hypothetical protein